MADGVLAKPAGKIASLIDVGADGYDMGTPFDGCSGSCFGLSEDLLEDFQGMLSHRMYIPYLYPVCAEYKWNESAFRNRLALLILLLRRGADPNETYLQQDCRCVTSVSANFYQTPVYRWIWSASLRECAYSVAPGQHPRTFRVAKSTEPYTGKSILEKDFVFHITCLCEGSGWVTTSEESDSCHGSLSSNSSEASFNLLDEE
jgi:hypothetical protein